jgi:hypothetical protein
MAPDFSGAKSIVLSADVLFADLLPLEDHSAVGCNHPVQDVGCNHPVQDEVTFACRRVGTPIPFSVIRRGSRECRGAAMSIVAAAAVIRSLFMMLLLSVIAPYRRNA